jgi:hypothetical protein
VPKLRMSISCSLEGWNSWLWSAARQGEPDAGWDHRWPAAVDGLDDLVRVDALEIDRCDAEVSMSELALDDVEQNALAREFDGVCVP